jgi:ribosomal protein S18 acetylase RimI-like enzyme
MRLEPLIREGAPADAEKLTALAIQVWLHTYATDGISSTISRYVLSEFTPERFAALLASTSVVVLVAEVNAGLVGCAVVRAGESCPEATGSTVELATLYVQEHFAGIGVGSALLARAETLAAQRAGKPLWLTVNVKNSRAIAFYTKHGYSKIGVTYFRLGGESHENHVLLGSDA